MHTLLESEKEEKQEIKRQLKAINEDLKSSNIEIRATNDELIDKTRNQKEDIWKLKNQIKDLHLKLDKMNELNNKQQEDYEELKEYTSLLEDIKPEGLDSKFILI